MQSRARLINRLFFITFLTLSPFLSKAQETEFEKKLYVITEFSYSQKSIIFLGKTPDTQSIIAYIGYGKRIKPSSKTFELYLTGGFLPYQEFRYPKRDNANRRDVVSGIGISPLGYTLIWPSRYFDFETRLKSGINFVDKTFPTDKGRRLNYSFDIKFAIQRKLFTQTYLSLGYTFHHISNAQTGAENPGIDSNFLFFSIKQF